jgi:four helix bundle protein
MNPASWSPARKLLFGAGMNPKATALQERTHLFFINVLRLCESLPTTDAARSIAQQLIDAAGATDSNYRGACRGRSRKKFIAKVAVAAEESDESHGWLLALVDAGICSRDVAGPLIDEANQLTAIFVSSQKTARRHEERAEAEKRRKRS